MSCKIILWRTLKCVLLLIAQLSNYFCAHYSEKWQYWKERENVHSFFPPCCTHWHPQEHKCLVKSLLKIRPNLWDISTSTIDDSKRQAMPSAPRTSVFALNIHRHTIFIVKFKNLIHGTQKQGHPQERVCLYFIHHLPGWFQLLLVSPLWIFPTTHRDTAELAREALTLHFSFSPLYLTVGPKKCIVLPFWLHYSTFIFG